jgi:hypothetical protein
MPRGNLIQFRAGTASAWTTANPILAAGEPGLETDTFKIKAGDGATTWTSLAYSSQPVTKALIIGTGLASSDIGAAPAASPTLTGTVTVPTPAAGDNTTKAASTSFVSTAITNAGGGNVNGGTP